MPEVQAFCEVVTQILAYSFWVQKQHLGIPEDTLSSRGRLLLNEELQELVQGRLQCLQILGSGITPWYEHVHLVGLETPGLHGELRQAGNEPYSRLMLVCAVLLHRGLA